jgi:hypothetical protein
MQIISDLTRAGSTTLRINLPSMTLSDNHYVPTFPEGRGERIFSEITGNVVSLAMIVPTRVGDPVPAVFLSVFLSSSRYVSLSLCASLSMSVSVSVSLSVSLFQSESRVRGRVRCLCLYPCMCHCSCPCSCPWPCPCSCP